MRVIIDRNHPEPVDTKKDERAEYQTAQPAIHAGLPTNRKPSKNLRVQQPTELDPRNARIGPPVYGDRTPEGQGHRTRHPGRGPRTSRKPGLRGIRDFVGFRTMRDPGLRGIQDFARPRTSWDLGLRRKQELCTPGAGSCSVVFSQRTQTFRIKLKTWTPLGIRLVVSVKYCLLFLWLYGHCPQNFIEPSSMQNCDIKCALFSYAMPV